MNISRSALIRDFVESAKAFDYTVQQGYPSGLLDWVPPSIPDAWSIRSHLVHVCDADLILHHRIRFAIAQPGTQVLVWDEEAWQKNLGYEKQNVTALLSLLRMLRAITGTMIENLSEDVWNTAYSKHPVKGDMKLADWLAMYTGHIYTHLDYVKRNEKAWEEAGCVGGGCS